MISYCITVYNEETELLRLLTVLSASKKDGDEIVIIQTYKSEQEQTSEEFLRIQNICQLYANTYAVYNFRNNFADMKNYMNSKVSENTKYIINLDADEVIDSIMLNSLRQFLSNTDIDVIFVPRANIVEGITEEDIKKWKWNMDDSGWINWPDYQSRIYRNKKCIKWVGAVHEHLEGYSSRAAIEQNSGIFISHIKTIDKQKQQNNFYDTLSSS